LSAGLNHGGAEFGQQGQRGCSVAAFNQGFRDGIEQSVVLDAARQLLPCAFGSLLPMSGTEFVIDEKFSNVPARLGFGVMIQDADGFVKLAR
jgi:hypothetical protein